MAAITMPTIMMMLTLYRRAITLKLLFDQEQQSRRQKWKNPAALPSSPCRFLGRQSSGCQTGGEVSRSSPPCHGRRLHVRFVPDAVKNVLDLDNEKNSKH
jgi:hypothetical protein